MKPPVSSNAPPKIAPSTATSWACQVSDLPSQGLTVGAPFVLKCAGEEVPGFDSQALSLELPKPDRYRLRILENRAANSSGVELVVTSYVPGDTNLQDVILTDGAHRVGLTGVQYTVMSVIPQGEQPKPFPPEPPVGLMWPMSAMAVIGAFFVALILLIAYLFQRRRSKRKFQTWLRAAQTPLSPFDQLSKDLRLVVKERNPAAHITELERMTRVFLARTLAEPVMNASSKKILKVLAKKLGTRDRKINDRLTPLTIRLFGEFERVTEALAKSQLEAQEALNQTLPQIHELVREFGEAIRHEQERRGRR